MKIKRIIAAVVVVLVLTSFAGPAFASTGGQLTYDINTGASPSMSSAQYLSYGSATKWLSFSTTVSSISYGGTLLGWILDSRQFNTWVSLTSGAGQYTKTVTVTNTGSPYDMPILTTYPLPSNVKIVAWNNHYLDDLNSYLHAKGTFSGWFS